MRQPVDFGPCCQYISKIFLEKGDRIAGFLFEPIQGEAVVIISPDGYLKSVRDLCSKYKVLMIADEVQNGLTRWGRYLACDWESVFPDVVILGNALWSGVLQVVQSLLTKILCSLFSAPNQILGESFDLCRVQLQLVHSM